MEENKRQRSTQNPRMARQSGKKDHYLISVAKEASKKRKPTRDHSDTRVCASSAHFFGSCQSQICTAHLSRKSAKKYFKKKGQKWIKSSEVETGRLVWGKIGSWPHWPGMTVRAVDCGMSWTAEGKYWILWMAENKISQVSISAMTDFEEGFQSYSKKCEGKLFKAAVAQGLLEYSRHKEAEDVDRNSEKDLFQWAKIGFPSSKKTTPNYDYSEEIRNILSRIRKRNKADESSSESSFPTSSSFSSDEDWKSWKLKASLLKKVREGEMDIEKICIACNSTDSEVVTPHPIVEGGLCQKCKEEYEDLITSGAIDCKIFCILCGSPGELLICDVNLCERVFCTGCIELLVSPKAVKKVKQEDPWSCFLCTPYLVHTHGLIKPRVTWKDKMAEIPSCDVPQIYDDIPPVEDFRQTPIRVLSLFDGIATDMYEALPEQVLNKVHRLQDYISKIEGREATTEVVNCITTNQNSLMLSKGRDWPIKMNEVGDTLWITEIEKVFGFPCHYTDTGNFGPRERQRLLGQAWSVPVIDHLFRPLLKYFPSVNQN